MDKDVIIKILVLLSLLSLLAGCDSVDGTSGGTTENPPELESVDPAANDSSALVGAGVSSLFRLPVERKRDKETIEIINQTERL